MWRPNRQSKGWERRPLWTADNVRLGRKRDQREELGNNVSDSAICAKVLRPKARIGGPEQVGNRDCSGIDCIGMNWMGPIEAAGTISIT